MHLAPHTVGLLTLWRGITTSRFRTVGDQKTAIAELQEALACDGVIVACPVCFGSGRITVLANTQTERIDCQRCLGRGYDVPGQRADAIDSAIAALRMIHAEHTGKPHSSLLNAQAVAAAIAKLDAAAIQ